MPRLVLVEYDADLRSIYGGSLQSAGYEVIAANTAQMALDALDENDDIDLVILDLALPVHNGITVLYEMMSYEDWIKIPVVVMSNVKQADLSEAAVVWQRSSLVAFLYKPGLRPSQLVQAVREYIA